MKRNGTRSPAGGSAPRSLPCRAGHVVGTCSPRAYVNAERFATPLLAAGLRRCCTAQRARRPGWRPSFRRRPTAPRGPRHAPEAIPEQHLVADCFGDGRQQIFIRAEVVVESAARDLGSSDHLVDHAGFHDAERKDQQCAFYQARAHLFAPVGARPRAVIFGERAFAAAGFRSATPVAHTLGGTMRARASVPTR